MILNDVCWADVAPWLEPAVRTTFECLAPLDATLVVSVAPSDMDNVHIDGVAAVSDGGRAVFWLENNDRTIYVALLLSLIGVASQ